MGQAPTATLSSPEPEQQEPLALVINKKNAAIPEEEEEALEQDSNRDNNSEPLEDNDLDCSTDKKGQKAKQRNYKNMTRERRIEANARERQRVQTITEQFDTLRSVIPVDDKSSKMSKLSIIKIATSYIMYMSRQLGYDYTEDKSEPSIEECYLQLKNLIKYEAKMNNAGPMTSTAACPQTKN